MISPVWTFKSVKSTFGMEYDQRVIIKFLWNEAVGLAILRTDFRHSLVNMFINFEQFDSGLPRHGSVVETCMMKFAPEELRLMILT
jgi:hypothetical protein